LLLLSQLAEVPLQHVGLCQGGEVRHLQQQQQQQQQQ